MVLESIMNTKIADKMSLLLAPHTVTFNFRDLQNKVLNFMLAHSHTHKKLPKNKNTWCKHVYLLT
jgi:hypothetical protein